MNTNKIIELPFSAAIPLEGSGFSLVSWRGARGTG